MAPPKIIVLAIVFATFVFSWHCSIIIEEVARVSRSLNAMSQRIDILQQILWNHLESMRAETMDMHALVLDATKLVRIALR
jgi:hypothetical protein